VVKGKSTQGLMVREERAFNEEACHGGRKKATNSLISRRLVLREPFVGFFGREERWRQSVRRSDTDIVFELALV
jgi:hypothetical protein